ncbi:YicC/YloC family endoribonuclease [Bacillus fonticola]|uniref:YicC/YloC family endoribonuclease n=1 Tax=Bacillus fonticola TaxID=2728853 RepID=UPI00223ED080|nr:YicC/YloC family endoribonuclease [Bacillus fonticola]
MSMTGFGRSQQERNGRIVTVEIKSVNHRYAEVICRLPKSIQHVEEPLKKIIQRSVGRGRVEVWISVTGDAFTKQRYAANVELAHSLVMALRQIKEAEQLAGDVSLHDLLQREEWLSVTEQNEDASEWTSFVEEVCQEATWNLQQMKREEGKALQDDLQARMTTFDNLIANIISIETNVAEAYKTRIQKRLSEWGITEQVEEQRLLTEMAMLIDKADISEECTRLQSHIKQFQQTLYENGSIGRKLDFLIQELNREVNTIGSKSQDAKLSSFVVECKTVLEKIREQVQNLE